MSPAELFELVLEYTNTNDYDDEARGWLETALHDGGEIFEISFRHEDGRTSTAAWGLIPSA